MDQATILRYVRQYHWDQRHAAAEEERILGERFRVNRCVTKSELQRVIAWKF